MGDAAEKQKTEAAKAAPIASGSRGGIISAVADSGFVKVIKNSATGFVSVYLFYVDVLSDIAVIVLNLRIQRWTTHTAMLVAPCGRCTLRALHPAVVAPCLPHALGSLIALTTALRLLSLAIAELPDV